MAIVRREALQPHMTVDTVPINPSLTAMSCGIHTYLHSPLIRYSIYAFVSFLIQCSIMPSYRIVHAVSVCHCNPLSRPPYILHAGAPLSSLGLQPSLFSHLLSSSLGLSLLFACLFEQGLLLSFLFFLHHEPDYPALAKPVTPLPF